MTLSPTDQSRLAELERLAERATPGEWEVVSDNGTMIPQPCVIDKYQTIICNVLEDNWDANARLIAASRSAIPWLIQWVRRLEKEGEGGE